MMRTDRTTVFVLLLLLLAGALRAQEPAPDPVPRYEVEIIVFEHLDQSRNTPEVAPLPQALTPREANGLPDAFQAREEETDSEPRVTFYIMPPHPRSPDFRPLPAEATRFDRLYDRLARVDAYRPLVQLGWTQFALSGIDAEPYRIPVALTEQTGIAGDVTLYKERYLHLKLDLARTPPRDRLGRDGRAAAEVARLVESRRIRGTEVQYFDHPTFGVIASIREITPPGKDGPERAASRLSPPAAEARPSGG